MKFSELQLHPILQANLDKINFSDCTPIQEQAIPLLRTGKDMSGLAQTGTGKTGAFLIPLIDRLLKAEKPDPSIADTPTVPFNEWKKRQYILVLVPTRELCDQVWENAKKFLEGTGMSCTAIYGGTTYDKQIAALKAGVEFVIATPGRFIDLYKEHVADLGLVRAIVFDEADRMFDMGFKDDMKFILKRVPRDRQFLVFSATLNFEVLNVAYEYGADPVEINISRDQAKADNVKDYILHIGQEDKPKYLLSLIKKHNPKQAIIFSNFKHNVERIANFLTANGIPGMGISSLLTQGQRNRVMAQFKAENEKNILVATDLAARGLDILGVDLVLNFDLPEDAENYVHRIGRTGRAGQTGQAFSLVSDRDVESLQRIEEYLKHKVEAIWMEDAELATDFKPFPSDRGFGGGGGPKRRDGPGGGPNRGGDRSRGGGDRDRAPRSGDRGPRPQRAGGGGNGPRRDQQHARGGSGEGTGQHRDRSSGRHRDGGAGGGQGDNRPRHGRDGQPQGPRPHGQGQGSGRHQGPRPQGQGGGGGGGQRPGGQRHGGGNGQQRGQGGRHQGGRPHGQRHGSGGGSRPAGKMVAAPSIGQKVSGFFKKLFGSKES